MGRTSDARERLLTTAVELFETSGYHAVGIQQICQAAGVNKGSFYHFFPSKRDLALAAIDERLRGYRLELLQPALGSDLPTAERFGRFFRLMYRQRRDLEQITGCFFGNLTLELSTHDESVRHRLAAVFRGWTAAFEGVLQAGIDRGELAEHDTAETAEAVLALFEGAALLAKAYNDAAVLERLAASAVRLVEQAAAPERLDEQAAAPERLVERDSGPER